MEGKFPDLSLGLLEEQDHMAEAHRLDLGRAVFGVPLDVDVGGGDHGPVGRRYPLAARGAVDQIEARRYPLDCIHIVSRDGEVEGVGVGDGPGVVVRQMVLEVARLGVPARLWLGTGGGGHQTLLEEGTVLGPAANVGPRSEGVVAGGGGSLEGPDDVDGGVLVALDRHDPAISIVHAGSFIVDADELADAIGVER